MGMNKKTVSVFGSTGSVGRSTVELLAHHKNKYSVEVLTANTDAHTLAEQAKRLNAQYAVIADEAKLDELKSYLSNTNIKCMGGRAALVEMASHDVDWVMMAIVGMAGLQPIFNALKNGKYVAIANKEPLVSAGELVMKTAVEYGATILPVDSEHNAIFQVFEAQNREAIERIVLTASGGPFRTWSKSDIETATPEQAIAHPNWSMGAKISVDSASMVNKGLEVIEAHHLFGLNAGKIDVLVHPQSIVHSMVQYRDGSVLAQLGAADMSTPIVNALGYPERIETCGRHLDIKALSQLTFEQPDVKKFPALAMAYDVLRAGGCAPLVFNAANEIAVEAFLTNRIAFGGIVDIIRHALERDYNNKISSLEEVIDLDQTVRTYCRDHLNKSYAA
mgnify:CR=1 FL=1